MLGGELKELLLGGGDVNRRVRLTSSQNYTWPFDGVENAVVNFVDDSSPSKIGLQITIPNTDWSATTTVVEWSPPVNSGRFIPLGVSLSPSGTELLFLARVTFPRNTATNQMVIYLSQGQTGFSPGSAGPNFASQFVNNGRISFTSSQGRSLTISDLFRDASQTEPYNWQPNNLVDVRAFGAHLFGLTDRTLRVQFDSNPSVAKFNGFTVNNVEYNTPGVHEITSIDDDEVFNIVLAGSGNDGRVDIFPQPNTE